MKRRPLIITIELMSVQKVKYLKDRIREMLDEDGIDVIQIQVNVIKKK